MRKLIAWLFAILVMPPVVFLLLFAWVLELDDIWIDDVFDWLGRIERRIEGRT